MRFWALDSKQNEPKEIGSDVLTLADGNCSKRKNLLMNPASETVILLKPISEPIHMNRSSYPVKMEDIKKLSAKS